MIKLKMVIKAEGLGCLLLFKSKAEDHKQKFSLSLSLFLSNITRKFVRQRARSIRNLGKIYIFNVG